MERLFQEQKNWYESRLRELQRRERQMTPNPRYSYSVQMLSAIGARLSAPAVPSPPAPLPRTYAINKPFVTEAQQRKYHRSTSCNPLSSGNTKERRARSASRSRSYQKNKEIAPIKCPTCKNMYGVYIFQCGDGHSSCKDCKTKGSRCGICGKSITDMRNITLEAYVSEKNVLCPNANEGCCLSFKPEQMETHIKECPYKNQECPLAAIFGKCSWRGKLSQMLSHFNKDHPETRQGAVNTELLIPSINTNSITVYFIDIGSYYFLVYMKIDETEFKIHMTIQLIGTSVSASKWSYEIHMYNKSEPHKKYQYSDICQPYSISVNEIFKDAKCMVIPHCYALGFVHEGCIAYKLFLNKDFERGRGRSNN